MKVPLKLQDLLQQNEAMMTPFLMLLGQGNAVLDCSNVETLEPEQLDLLFSHTPNDWDLADFWPLFDVDTLSETFATQLEEWINLRHGKTLEVSPPPTPLIPPVEPQSQSNLDIFNLRDSILRYLS